MYLCTTEEMRELDRYTIETIGIPGTVLMERAGLAVTQAILSRFPLPKRAIVLIGTGNNGGDGWVIARHLCQSGWEVKAWLLGDPSKLPADARCFYDAYRHFGSVSVLSAQGMDGLESDLEDTEVIVDALLGTGAKDGLRFPIDQVVQKVNQCHRAWTIAVDLPTGVNADTGKVMDQAIYADYTVTFAYPKWAFYLYPGADYVGDWDVVEIGTVLPVTPKVQVNRPSLWDKALCHRSPWSHKGRFGHLLVIGGADGMLGAVRMAGAAAYRCGTGKVTLTVPQGNEQSLKGAVMQEMVWSWSGDDYFADESSLSYRLRSEQFSAVVIGPGLGRFPGEEKWLGHLLEQIEHPVILDADAINILADHPHLLDLKIAAPLICTPHPGEMARLLRTTTQDVEQRRNEVAREYAMSTGMVVVLKGRFTIIAFPDGRQVVNPSGHPALAKAGSGDVLTGMIGAWLAQGVSIEEAVLMAVYLHGKAGEHSVTSAEQSVSVDEILAALGPVIQQYSF
ncbi:NAD(P)H-hydrate epimerase [Seinonella peptonophila]|uniref:Bifunctional NAD(P)H-hydrate repair enzyme n=1 Tax=Seinonella peptonophila TaxID=112248 RepID=A0A1M4YDE8_9BACL|nr:bifunctional ADP-dependent NAD(P)H-hydrate dehydratase/NAD(P)H-hydrate epimerase [Seinonella peptonophila]SHF03486.1 NAD(P)H-hydrate epimerase [Seinonella peptonophila]